jgi:ATP-dependent Clp endopeptidase proteolytic subunit ClpP
MKNGQQKVNSLVPGVKQVLQWEPSDWQYDQFLKSGVIFLQDEIDGEMSYEFAHEIIHLTKLEPPIKDGKQLPISIILDSPGGDVFAGFGIHNMIQAAVLGGAQVNIIGKGLMASMATVVLQAGSQRLALPHTQFLVHEISQSIFEVTEKVSETEERVEESKRLNRIVMGVIAERVGMSVDELIKISKKKDCWFDAKQALKLGEHGLIDKIVDTLPF